ncbi:MAG: sigma-70 family RNA polymerase sigma factor [Thermoanaerobaculia bacterium]|nr:MAG: sigma-70 family RNA polymerase sigma factor [Thermoanaerobaculia bacterium]
MSDAGAPGGTAPGSDESALLAGLRRGEERAFERLVALHGGRLLAAARRLLGSEEEARDALQEAFLQAFRGLAGFREDARLSTWLHRIVVNAALMRLRGRRSHPEEPIEPLLPTFREDGHPTRFFVAWGPGPESAAARAELAARVRAAIRNLPESHRTVLVLRDLEELETSEVAQLLGITPNAVKIRLHRARQALRQLLAPDLRPETT